MLFAITPRGVGRPVGARAINPGWPLAEGETFTVSVFEEGMVLGEDGFSVRRPAAAEKQAEAEDAAARAALADLDAKSIRSIREYIASRPDAPALLKSIETQAAAERTKVRSA